MGYLNGQDKAQKGEKGEKGQGFALTADMHIHLNNKRITNLSAPVHSHDATTKKFVTDLLKTKSDEIYVENELAKKALNIGLPHNPLICIKHRLTP